MSSMATCLPLGAFNTPASFKIDFVFARTMTVPSGITVQTRRVPGAALTRALTSAGTVVCPLAVMVDSATGTPYLFAKCNASCRVAQPQWPLRAPSFPMHACQPGDEPVVTKIRRNAEPLETRTSTEYSEFPRSRSEERRVGKERSDRL